MTARERYHSDSDFRERTLARNRKWNDQHGKARAAKRRQEEPEWFRLQVNLSAHRITLDQYHALMERQDFGCAICSRPFEGQTPHIDHNHTTGKARGLLCIRCNTGLGKFLDNPEMLEKASRYLR